MAYYFLLFKCTKKFGIRKMTVVIKNKSKPEWLAFAGKEKTC